MIELRVLGSLDLRTAGGQSLDEALRRSKRIALLAYLASARPAGFHRRDKVASLFWPELDKERARGALRTTLSRLRDDLGDDVVESRGSEEIGVRRDRLWCDVDALYECLDRDDAGGAADLYRGPMLDGVHIQGTSNEFEQWISEERAGIRAGLLGALSAQIDRQASAGEWMPALALAQRATLIAPDDESAARRLIQAALSAGNRGAALRAYGEIERVLRREYDVGLSADTATLVASLRGAAVASDARSPARDVGRLPARDTGIAATRRPLSVGAANARRVALAVAAAVLIVAVTWRVARVGMTSAVAASAATGVWRRVEPAAGAPRGRHHFRMAIDSTGDGIVLLGGASVSDGKMAILPLATDVWRFIGIRTGQGSQWIRVPVRVGPAPAARWMYGAAFDAPTDRWVVHGGAQGYSSPCSNDTWVLDRASGLSGASAWHPVRTRGGPPLPRGGHDVTFDASRRILIVFGGNDCFSTYFHDTWILTFDDSTLASGAWERILPDSSEGQPIQRAGYATVYDAAAARLFVYGGISPPRGATSELWVLEHADGKSGAPRWRSLHCAGDAPSLSGAANAYDDARDTWTFFGGQDDAGIPRRDLWRLDGLIRNSPSCAWSHVPTAEPWPLPRTSAAAVSVRARGAFALFGGNVEQFSVSDLWVFADSARRRVAP